MPGIDIDVCSRLTSRRPRTRRSRSPSAMSSGNTVALQHRAAIAVMLFQLVFAICRTRRRVPRSHSAGPDASSRAARRPGLRRWQRTPSGRTFQRHRSARVGVSAGFCRAIGGRRWARRPDAFLLAYHDDRSRRRSVGFQHLEGLAGGRGNSRSSRISTGFGPTARASFLRAARKLAIPAFDTTNVDAAVFDVRKTPARSRHRAASSRDVA